MSHDIKENSFTQMLDELKSYRLKAEEKEDIFLHPKAARSKDHQRYNGADDDHRLPYKRDVDRILHSKAFARYTDKTQVVYLVDNDHVTHRSLHVQLVSNFARGIGEILNLNLDLIEAISLGHDVGHPPFGHEGEGYLSELSEEYGNGKFTHPLQSCRLFSVIEPLNLGVAVYDGFLCHDGGMRSGIKLKPKFGSTLDDHLEDRKRKSINPDDRFDPATLEGCLVKLSDTMSYVGKDIEDAIGLGILDRSTIPETFLGNTNRTILRHLAEDMIKESYGKDYIAISQKAFDALKVLRDFNFRHIYTHPRLKQESAKIKRGYRIMFELLLADFEKNSENSHVGKFFFNSKPEEYKKHTTAVQAVVDYISGMTDSYFVRTLESLVIPKRIQLS